jgi:hypothetical protein
MAHNAKHIRDHRSFALNMLSFLKSEVKYKPTYSGVKLLGLDPNEPENGFIVGIGNKELYLYIYKDHYSKGKDGAYINLRDPERVRGNGSLLQYTIDKSNFKVDKNGFKIIQNRYVTIGRKQTGVKEDSIKYQKKYGFEFSKPIITGSVSEEAFSTYTRSLFKWLTVRRRTKIKLESRYLCNNSPIINDEIAVDISEHVRRSFAEWILATQTKVNNAAKYLEPITAASNFLGRDLYLVTDPDELLRLRDRFYKKRRLSIAAGHNQYSRAFDLFYKYLSQLINTSDKEEEKEVKKVLFNKKLSASRKRVLMEARIGQGTYRKNLIALWKGCSISNYAYHKVLIASHMKPWKDCDNYEKLDRYNGLLLLPTYDRLFDKGYITFEDNGKLRVSKALQPHAFLNLTKDTKIEIKSLHKPYLQYHRKHIFEKWKKKKNN